MSKYFLPGLFFFSMTSLSAQTIWNGDFIIFEKESQSAWELEENQDRITNDVWITRKSSQGIFNIRQEDGYATDLSPMNTAWSFGTTAQIDDLSFLPWELAIGSNPIGALNDDMVLHLLQDDVYIDIKFLSWQGGGAGGGFRYQRATATVLNVESTEKLAGISLFPNPTKDRISFLGLTKPTEMIILDATGKEIEKLRLSPGESIDVSYRPQGIYFILIDRSRILKWVKL